MGGRKKAIISTILAAGILFGATAVSYAGTVSVEEKAAVMAAAGNVDEGNARIKRDDAVAIGKKLLEGPEFYEVTSVRLDKNWQSDGQLWYIDFRRIKSPDGNVNVIVDADTGELLGFGQWENYTGQGNYVLQYTRQEAQARAEEYMKNVFRLDPLEYELQKEQPYNVMYRVGGVKENVIYYFNYYKKINGIPCLNYTVNVGIDGTSGKLSNYSLNKVNIDTSDFDGKAEISPEGALEKYVGYVNPVLQYILTYEEKAYSGVTQKVNLAYVPSLYINMIDAKTGKIIGGNEFPINTDSAITPLVPGATLSSRAITETEAKSKAEELKKTVEGIFGVTFDTSAEKGYFESRYYENQTEGWNYNWNQYNDKGSAGLSFTINGKTDHLLNLNVNSWDNSYDMNMKLADGKQPEVVETVSWAQGREKAVEYVKKLIPEQYGFFAEVTIGEPQYNVETKKYMREHNYSFVRVVNGIRFRDNTVNVSIDRQTGALRNLYMNWSDMDFLPAEGVISKEAAVKKLLEASEAKLAYFVQSSYDYQQNKTIFSEVPDLVYSFETNGFAYGNLNIDAFSGNFVDWSGKALNFAAPVGDIQLSDHWAKRSVELLAAQGIVTKVPFDYEAKLTREEAVRMLSVAKGMAYYDMSLSRVPTFTDVAADSPNFSIIENAVRQNIISAGQKEFKGSEYITAEEFARLLVNLTGYQDIAKYKDIFKAGDETNVSEDMTGYIAICRVLDILPVEAGVPFDGKAQVTHAQGAVALYKALRYIK